MKRIKNILLAFTFLFGVVSCNDLLDINQDPNAASTANITEVLTSGQARIAYLTSRFMNSATMAIWSQYWGWSPTVNLGPAEKFEYVATSSNGMWSTAYASAFQDFELLLNSGEDNYIAIANLLKAYAYGLLVDQFGQVPYSEANKAISDDIVTPVFDDGASVYAALITLVEESIDRINNAAPGSLTPTTNDLFYQGNMASWVKFGNSLKLKLLVRQSQNGGPADLADQITAAINNGGFIEVASDNTELPWMGATGSENPLYATLESGLGNFYTLSQTSLDVMSGLRDPRLDAIYNAPASGTHLGTMHGIQPSGDLNDYSRPSGLVYGPALPSVIMSATEVWFYRAEAALLFGAGDAVSTFNEGVKSSFESLNINSSATLGIYLDGIDYANQTDENKLRALATQMWIAFNGTRNVEGWITTRKFDNANRALFSSEGGYFQEPVANSLGSGLFPSILRFPQTEIDLNPNAPAQNSLTGKVFWDN